MLKDFTDIRFDGWIERVPEKWWPYVHLMRLDRPIGVWLLLLPCWWSIMLATAQVGGIFRCIWLMALFSLGAIIMRGAGCVINDIWDRKLDAKVERTRSRPLASGQVSLLQAFAFLFCLLFIGLCILVCLNRSTVLLGLFALPLVVLYPFMKRITFWPQAFLGLTFNFGALMGWSAVTGEQSYIAWLLYAGGICWTLAYDSIYAHQDKDDDVLIGVRSTALLWGENSRTWVCVFLLASVVLLCCALYSVSGAWLGVVGAFFLAAHTLWQLKVWDMNEQESSLSVFKANRFFGLAMAGLCVLALLIGN